MGINFNLKITPKHGLWYNPDMVAPNRQVAAERAVASLRQAAPTGSQIILFGSFATGQIHRDSDIDLMVVEPELTDWIGETARLRQAIGRIGIPIDLVVVDRQRFDRWRETPTTVYYEAATRGRICD
jgi:uncharacterized protein